MRNILGIGGGVLAVCFTAAVASEVGASPAQNPYRVILAHNAFKLRPIVAVPNVIAPPPTAAAPSPKVFLTGIATLSGPKAFLQVEDPQTKKTEFLPPLAAGERYKAITVLAIDPLNQTVRIKNENEEDTLDFLNDGVKPKAVAATPPLPVPPRPPAVPAPVPTPPFIPPSATPPTRGVIVTGGQTPNAQPNYANGAARRNVPVMTREQVEARMALERQIRERNNDPTYKLLPAVR